MLLRHSSKKMTGRTPSRSPAAYTDGLCGPWCVGCFPRKEFAEVKRSTDAQTVQKDMVKRHLAGSSFGNAIAAEADVGELKPIAARVVMKVFYAARVARFDLLRAVGHLACFMTRWTPECDRRLHHMMCCTKSSAQMMLRGWIGNHISDIRAHLYSDADFAGCQDTNKSTTGGSWPLKGQTATFPLQQCLRNRIASVTPPQKPNS